MAQTVYADRLKKATDLATRATHLEASLSSLSPLSSPLPALHKAFPLYILAAENYSHLLLSGLVPESEKANVKKKWRLVLERAEKVKKRIESLGGHVGKIEVSDDVEEEKIIARGGHINGFNLDLWTDGRIDYGGPVVQPELAREQTDLDPEWATVEDEEWDVDLSKERWVVRQGPGADCSVVAGFGACLEHNRRWGTSIGRSAMFPQTHTSSTITPQKTDNGRHVVKLLLNGAWRSVLIDALLPRSNGTKLPLHATSHPEGTVAQEHSIGPPWIPLILKGYFKAYGGYSLRGSNPAPDIYTLTGWIPERIHLRGGLQREKEWKRIFGSWKRGEVIVTIGTGSRDSLGDGLIPYHAYAILDMAEREDGERLLKVYDPGITRQYAEELHIAGNLADSMQSLAIETGGMTHSGIITKTWDAICTEFETLNLNWNPALLPVTARRYWSWSKPIKEEAEPLNTIQYKLDVQAGSVKPGDEVWIMLSQHITNQDRSLDDIALHVQEESVARPSLGLRTESHEERIASSSPYSNAVHILYRYPVRRSNTTLTVIPLRDRGVYRTDFTLQAFASSGTSLNLRRISTSLPFSTSVTGELTSKSAGGHAGLPSWIDNPQYKMTISPSQNRDNKSETSRLILQGSVDLAWNIKILRSDGSLIAEYGQEALVADSGAYSYGMAFADVANLKPGVYTVSVSSFQPGQVGKYTLSVESGSPNSLTPIPAEGAGMYNRTVNGVWTVETAGGRPSGGNYHQNVQIEITLPHDCTLMSILPSRSSAQIPINATLFARGTGGGLGGQIATSGSYSDAIAGVSIPRTRVSKGVYVLVLSAWETGLGVGDRWENRIWADAPLSVERVK